MFKPNHDSLPYQLQIHRCHDPSIIQTQQLPIMRLQAIHADLPEKSRILSNQFLEENDPLPLKSTENRKKVALCFETMGK